MNPTAVFLEKSESTELLLRPIMSTSNDKKSLLRNSRVREVLLHVQLISFGESYMAA